ncbi:MAG: class I SAM-dependent methyltransferase [Pseudomonadota bacterium]
MQAEPASFRDPSGRIYHQQGRIFRSIAPEACDEFDRAQANPALRKLVEQGDVVRSMPVAQNDDVAPVANGGKIVEHEKLPFISYPYEWSFSLLKRAALHHLDLQLALLPSGVALSDATAYNVQFMGVRPIFIDALSFQPYKEGDYWTAHRQFCEQFLNPLLMTSIFGLPHNEWFRGALEGVPTPQLARMLPLSQQLSFRILTHILMPAWFQQSDSGADMEQSKKALQRPLSKNGYLGLLTQLHRWISGLQPRGANKTTWADYAENNSYDGEEHDAKTRAIAAYANACKPALLCDFGCNTGHYTEIALTNGAENAIGFDLDHGALEGAYARASGKELSFLPLYQDAANPSPNQGWGEEERAGLNARCEPVDGLIALAFIHHMSIGRNIPLDQLVEWLCASAPSGVIEFVPKEDPMVRKLLALRKDIFSDYTLEAFRTLLERHARIVKAEQVTQSGRVLFTYDRR